MVEGSDGADASYRRPPSEAVVEAVAREEGISPASLCPPTYEPLHATVDPDALDALFQPRANGMPRSVGEVTFRYCGYDVTVRSDGTVALRDPTA